MKNLSRVILVFVLLMLITSIASAKGPDLEPFSTTGYTTNLEDNPLFDPSQSPGPTNPPLLPSQFAPLPSGHTKFHISAQGGAGVTDDCQLLLDLYGMPSGSTCEDLCLVVTGQVCGTTGMFNGGSFSFEEWGIYYPVPVVTPGGLITTGANYGDMAITTEDRQAIFHFGGQTILVNLDTFEQDVLGSFMSLNRSGKHRKLKGQGTYTGDADFVFTVDYTPCEGDDCPDRCAVFGDEKLKVKKDKIEWKIKNEGEDDLTISRITLNWQGSEIELDKVKLGGKTLNDDPETKDPIPPVDSGKWSNTVLIEVDPFGPDNILWDGKVKDIQIKNGKQAKLAFEFEDERIGQEPSDYTILVEFAEGCAVTFVAFP